MRDNNNLFEIKKRVAAASKTRKITRTMELIASSRLQRGKARLADAQEWLRHMHEAAQYLPESYFELPRDLESGRRAYIVFGGTKGLSGAYGPNLMRYAKPVVSGHVVIAVGSAAGKSFPDAEISLKNDIPSPDFAGTVAREAKALYDSKEVSMVSMVYMRGTEHVTERLLPIQRESEHVSLMIAEPSAELLFPALYEEYVEAMVYTAYLHAFVTEQIARVSAMDGATRNADEIIDNLQATYNRIRQAAITQEIISISNAISGGGS